MKTTVEIPNALFRQAKKYAASSGLTLREVIETALRRTLEGNASCKTRFRLRDGSFKGSGPVAGEDWETFRNVLYEKRGK